VWIDLLRDVSRRRRTARFDMSRRWYAWRRRRNSL